MDSIVGILGLSVGIACLIIAWYQYKDKRKLEQFSKATLRGMAGNIAKIQQSSEWAAANFRYAQNTAIELKDSEQKSPLLQYISNGIGDAVATDRLVINLFNDVLNMQQAQFNTRIITHPEKEDLKFYNKEKEQQLKGGVDTIPQKKHFFSEGLLFIAYSLLLVGM
jgi:hypothetical protein